jgi:lipopolysaccharide transport system permease protein
MRLISSVPSDGRLATCYEPPSLRNFRPAAELRRLPRFFDLLCTLSVHRVKVRYKQSHLGLVWAVLQPLAMMIVFVLMFSFIGTPPSQGVPYPVFAYAALMPWTAFSSGLSSASGSLTTHATLLTKVAFPREILPVTYAIAALVDLGMAATTLVVLMIWYHVGITASIAWAPVAVVLLALFLVGTGLLFSALQVRYRDVGLALPIALQVWMFATPVLYPLAVVRHALRPTLYVLYILNPMAGVVETFRRAVVLHQNPDAASLLASVGVIAIVLSSAYVYFKFSERTMADVI